MILVLVQGVLQFGMVIENAEFMSSEESGGSEDEEQVKMGTVRVAWYPAGTEEVNHSFCTCFSVLWFLMILTGFGLQSFF